MSDAHAAAVVAALQADPDLTVHDGPPPDGSQPPYVVVWVAVERLSDLLCGSASRSPVWVYTHAVGVSTTAARRVGDRVRGVLLDQRLNVPGWKCAPVRLSSARPPDPAEVAGVTYIDQTDVWRFNTTLT